MIILQILATKRKSWPKTWWGTSPLMLMLRPLRTLYKRCFCWCPKSGHFFFGGGVSYNDWTLKLLRPSTSLLFPPRIKSLNFWFLDCQTSILRRELTPSSGWRFAIINGGETVHENVGLILLMVQKSCIHQLRLVVYPTIYKVLAPSQVVYLAGFLNPSSSGAPCFCLFQPLVVEEVCVGFVFSYTHPKDFPYNPIVGDGIETINPTLGRGLDS